MPKSTRSLLVVALVLAAGSSKAQGGSTDNTKVLAQAIAPQCPELVSRLVGRKEMALTLQARPLDLPEVCKCAMAGLPADKGLQERMAAEPGAYIAKMPSERLNSYFFTRIVTSIMACLVPELEKSMTAAPIR